MRRRKRAAAILGLLVVGGAGPAAGPGEATDRPPVEGEGGRAGESLEGGGWFFCAMGQTVKYAGILTGNLGLAVAGAIGGGIACGMGW